MHRWLAMAAIGSCLLTSPLWGQRGGRGGMSVGGGHGMVAGGVAGRGPVMARPASGYGGQGFVTGAPARSGAVYYHHGFYPVHYPFRFGFRFGHRWRYSWWGYPFGYGGGYAYPIFSSYGDPGWNGDPMQSYPPNDSSYDQYRQLQQNQIDRLSDEVARLQQERQASGPSSQSQPKTSIRGETVLIFRDKHSEEVQNYAIVGKTFWIFNEGHARKIPIAELDVPATIKANQDRGIDFSLPR